LANLLLSDQGWDKDRIGKKVSSHKRKVVALENPIPVQSVYTTAWIDDDGTIHFFRDLYGHDKRLLAELNRFDGARPTWAADLMAVDRILEKRNAGADSKPARRNNAAKVY
jgi:murein L,D-transpeptidase YcbB/YkuD